MNKLTTNRRVVGISDMIASDNPTDTIVTYSLGSCLAIVCYDSVVKAAAMIHIMLPDSNIEKMSKNAASFNPLKYVDTGFTELMKECQKFGMRKSNICLSVFGGAQIFEREDHFNIGKRNYIALRKMIWQNGLLIRHEHVGGRVHRTVKIDVDSGEITLDVNKEKIINYHCSSSRK